MAGLSTLVSKNYFVCNPTTKQYRLLPDLESSILGVSLAFDPSTSLHYKVICVMPFNEQFGSVSFGFDKPCQIDIYSSEDQYWRSLAYRFRPPFARRFESGIFWNHAIHWFSEEFVSLRFDFNAENLIGIPMPPSYVRSYHWSCRYFGVCGNHLRFIRICQSSAKKFCILEMSRDYSKWFIKYSVRVCHLISGFPEIVVTTSRRGFQETISAFSGLNVVKRLKDEDSALMLRIPGKVILSNFMHKTVKALWKLPRSTY